MSGIGDQGSAAELQQAIAAAAEFGKGTRYVANCCQPRVVSDDGRVTLEGGFDCIQWVKWVGETARVLSVDPELEAKHMPYSQTPDGHSLIAALNDFLLRLERDAWGVGDVALFTMAQAQRRMVLPQHLGVIVSPKLIVHAQNYRGVCEFPISDRRFVRRCWRYPGLAEAMAEIMADG